MLEIYLEFGAWDLEFASSMKVLMITTSFPRVEGDYSGHFILQMALALKERGLEVEVIAPGAPEIPNEEVLQGIPVHRFLYAFPPRLQKLAYEGGILSNLKRSWLARFEILPFFIAVFYKTFLFSKKAQLLHVHWIPTGYPVLLVSRFVRKPLVLTVHGSDLNSLGFLKPFYTFLLRKIDRTVCVSRSLKEGVIGLGISPSKVSVVPNGVELSDEKISESRTERFNLLWVGRMVVEKGLFDLLEGMKRIVREIPSATLTLVGEGPLRQELEKTALSLDLQDHIIFTGVRPHKDIKEFLRASTLFVLPSLSEGLPIVLLEAMAQERAVVATRVGGIPEVIQDGKTGLLIPPKSPDSLAMAVIRLLRDEKLRMDIGMEGRKRIEIDFSWGKRSEEMARVYDSLFKK